MLLQNLNNETEKKIAWEENNYAKKKKKNYRENTWQFKKKKKLFKV